LKEVSEIWNTQLWTGLDVTPGRIVLALAVLLGGWLASRLFGLLLGRSAAGRNLEPSVRYSVGRLVHYILLVLTALMALTALGVNMSSLAVVAGALGLGIGFGLQTIVANFIAGLILLFERPIRVGDRISLGDVDQEATGQVNGYVRAIKLRATTVETPDSITLIVPNSEFVTRTIVNWSFGQSRMRIRLNIGVAYGSDIDLVTRIIHEAAMAHPTTIKEPDPEVRLVATADSALEFQLLVWIPDARLRGRVDSELRFDLVRRFRAAGVTIPFPQRDLHIVDAPDALTGRRQD